ncbi:MAG: PocR ligand-binding domain-containing protein [Chloroflexota bacterium]
MDTLLTARQVQDLLKVDRTTIYRMLQDGRLTGVKVGFQWRFHAREVEELISGSVRLGGDNEAVSAGVLPLHCVQPMQDVFAEIAEVGSVTTDKDGQPLTRLSNSCDFCKLILGSENGRQACIDSWRQLAQQKGQAAAFVTCHAGLQYACACIEVGGDVVASLVAGQFYVAVPDRPEETERIQALAEKFGISPALLSQAAQHIPVLDERKVSQIGEWLKRVARTFEQISSERANLMKRLRQIAAMSVFES